MGASGKVIVAKTMEQCRLTDKCTNEQMEKKTYKQMGRRTDEQTQSGTTIEMNGDMAKVRQGEKEIRSSAGDMGWMDGERKTGKKDTYTCRDTESDMFFLSLSSLSLFLSFVISFSIKRKRYRERKNE